MALPGPAKGLAVGVLHESYGHLRYKWLKFPSVRRNRGLQAAPWPCAAPASAPEQSRHSVAYGECRDCSGASLDDPHANGEVVPVCQTHRRTLRRPV